MVDTILLILISVFCIVILALLFSIRSRLGKEDGANRDMLLRAEQLRKDIDEQQRALRMELSNVLRSSVTSLGDLLSANQKAADRTQADKLEVMDRNLSAKQQLVLDAVVSQLNQLEGRFKTFATENEQKIDLMRNSVEKRLSYIQDDNNGKLDEIRKIVDEKLQKTLEERMTQSFRLVNERLEQVYKGLGEMQTLAVGVGDLKKVLSNVKTRGILGEIQLGAILEEIMAPEQYAANVITKHNGSEFVEYAIKLPADGETPVYLPIDSKFPADRYEALVDAYESGEPARVAAASAALKANLRASAKDIHDKYVSPPETTDFAILFLPTEGLYAEAVKLGLVETLQREYKINIAGPSTMAALLNSLQMGFRTVAIQKRSNEVWNILGAVKTEFDTFGDVLAQAQRKIEQANSDLDKLIGVRTRQIQRKLKHVTTLKSGDAPTLLGDTPEYEDESEIS